MTLDSAITPDEMKSIEERAERLGVSRLMLMESAGKAVADYIANLDSVNKKVLVVAGTGNNGGDGFVAARHLAAFGLQVKVFLLGTEGDIRTKEASINWKVLKGMDRSIELKEFNKFFMEELKQALAWADVLVDAIFGTGIKGELRDPQASVIELINESKVFRLAVDVPSGLDPLTGEVCGKAVKANATITFHRVKRGLTARKDLVGKLVVANIGIPPEAN
jgi:NAD(P)H-hydrate epimerase